VKDVRTSYLRVSRTTADRFTGTDFLAAGGEHNYAWNVVRSEADEMMYEYAGECGAQIFDGIKVISIKFDQSSACENGTSHSANGTATDGDLPGPGRPVSAEWSRKSDGANGVVKFDYIVDATGRAGLLNTKYLKNRQYNTTLKNVANWAYFEGGGLYGEGTGRANSPFFEALLGTHELETSSDQ
jgi:flavin-dependent dehydrogenase